MGVYEGQHCREWHWDCWSGWWGQFETDGSAPLVTLCNASGLLKALGFLEHCKIYKNHQAHDTRPCGAQFYLTETRPYIFLHKYQHQHPNELLRRQLDRINLRQDARAK